VIFRCLNSDQFFRWFFYQSVKRIDGVLTSNLFVARLTTMASTGKIHQRHAFKIRCVPNRRLSFAMRPRPAGLRHAQLPICCALPAEIEELPWQNQATNLLRLPEQNQTKGGQSAEVAAVGRFETAFFEMKPSQREHQVTGGRWKRQDHYTGI
jgi:hypothetical protein